MIINSYRRQLQVNANIDSEYEALKLKITEIQQRKNLLEDSIRYKQSDYQKQLEQQGKDIEYLQTEVDSLKRQNAEMGTQCNATQSDIIDAKSVLNQREIEISRIKTEIARSHDQTRFLRENIEDVKRQLHQNYQTKEHQ